MAPVAGFPVPTCGGKPSRKFCERAWLVFAAVGLSDLSRCLTVLLEKYKIKNISRPLGITAQIETSRLENEIQADQFAVLCAIH